MSIHSTIRHVGFISPHFIQQRRPRQRLIRVTCESIKQVEFPRGEYYLLFIALHHSCSRINHESARMNDGRNLARSGTTQNGSYPRQKFHQRKGLDEVIIAPLPKSLETMCFFAFGREDDHWHVIE